MPRIVEARACLADIATETVRTDAVQSFVKQETVFVDLATDDGNAGTGYTYTIGTGGSSVLAMLRDHLLPRLIGADATRVERLWHESFASTRATTVGAITSLALAAVDTALWDLRCLRAGEPLWRLAGGFRPDVPLYDTEGGWLHLSTDELVRRRAGRAGRRLAGRQDKSGQAAHRAGRGAATRGARRGRVHARAHGGREPVDDGRRGLPPRRGVRTARPGVVRGAAARGRRVGARVPRRSTSIPVAVGESLYSVGQFRDYLHRGAASVVQVDVARVGGITPWLKVAHLAEAFNVHVCPHFLMELHVSLVAAIPNGRYVEHIPQLRAITRGQLQIEDGRAIAPDEPGSASRGTATRSRTAASARSTRSSFSA